MLEFEVDQNKLRLDRFLSEKVTEVSRSKIQKDIRAGLVFVNDEVALESKMIVDIGDQVEYNFQEQSELKPVKLDIKVIFENKDIVVIDKPPGLVVHPAPGYKGVTLVEGLLYKYKDIQDVGGSQVRPGIVHRLDKDTSGVMLVAKTQGMFEHLKDSFATRKIKKEYVALVCGHVPSKQGIIDSQIGKHPTDFRRMTTVNPTNPKLSLTEYQVLEYLDGYTLIMVKLHTGRTHQIRVHFSSLGFPLAGDTLYGKCRVPGLERQFLHARKIEVQLPDGIWIEAESELPEDLNQVLSKLRQQ
jgi:23S rRNA pseudouridine1911/1915/1917 synthase